MYQPEQRVIRLRATGPNHQWAMEMVREGQIHNRDGRKWALIQETTNQHGLYVTIQEIKFTKTQQKTEAKTMTTEIEKTKRALYDVLDRIRRAGKHRRLTAEFEERMEEHLEALRLDRVQFTETLRDDLARRLVAMTEERDGAQQRLHAVDHAYNEQSLRNGQQAREIASLYEANKIAGEELQRVQEFSRRNLKECQSAEKLSDDLSEKLTHATTVIGQQEQLIAGQRKAIADMHNELAHRRVICKSLQLARAAFTHLDEALHGSEQSKAMRAVGDDVVDAEWQP